jgi:hypothetical protein
MAGLANESSWVSFAASFAQQKVSQQLTGVLRHCGRGQCDQNDKLVHPDGNSQGRILGEVPDEPRQWYGFEYADLMEQGQAAGLTRDFLGVPSKNEEVRLCVSRSPDRKEFLLTTQEGPSCLLARLSDNGCDFNIFMAKDGQAPVALGPMFTLTANRTQDCWTLCASTCDCCEIKGKRLRGARELAYIRHFKEHIGPSDQDIHCVDMEVPCMTEDGMDVWCPVCKPEGKYFSTDLTSRRPKWNARVKAVALDFFGRVSMASTKNFQLALDHKPDKVKLLFGKVGPHQYVLDFHRPLSMIQAFAVAISSFTWQQ